ncbi:MAG: hypothetical protein VX325_01270 [Bacteroidota bacterium]|nr:hypothetical protein [Bacteroidota bacterium]
MKKNITKTLIFFLIIMTGCKNQEKKQHKQSDKNKITISKLEGSPNYDGAALSIDENNLKFNENGEVNFDFKVENYDLGAQTANAKENGLANSGKGQHIHFILNNGPYSAHYDSNFDKTLDPGNNVVLSFLSRSYHESLKNTGAFSLIQLNVGEQKKDLIDLSSPLMFYSRPKGTYEGDDTKKLLLDFYLINTEISPDGNKVRATVNGEEFLIDEWTPHYIEGLPLGEVIVKLELLDSNGNLIDTPFNPVERKVILQ